jgi:RNA polymerase sigma-70 factor (ECF subfamily)
LSEILFLCDYLYRMRDAGRSAAGQDQQYADAAARFGPALERLARAYERDPDKRRDLLQDIHIALWRSLARFDGRCSLRTWVYRVAHNTATSKVLRPRASAPTLVAIDDCLETLAEIADGEQVLDRSRAIERLHELVQRLRPLDRQVMVLYLEQEDAASIAEITGLSAANVATKVSRIRQLLIQRFHQGTKDGQQR